jgi:hypothetical protein
VRGFNRQDNARVALAAARGLSRRKQGRLERVPSATGCHLGPMCQDKILRGMTASKAAAR